MSLQDLYITYLFKKKLNPATDLRDDFDRWQKEISSREAKFVAWVSALRSMVQSEKTQVSQVEKFNKKFEATLDKFTTEFGKDPVLVALRDRWIPELRTRFNLPFEWNLALDIPPRGSAGADVLPRSDETDRRAIEQEIANFEQNVQPWSETLLEFLSPQVASDELKASIAQVLGELKTLNQKLQLVNKELADFQSRKLKLLQERKHLLEEDEKVKKAMQAFPKPAKAPPLRKLTELEERVAAFDKLTEEETEMEERHSRQWLQWPELRGEELLAGEEEEEEKEKDETKKQEEDEEHEAQAGMGDFLPDVEKPETNIQNAISGSGNTYLLLLESSLKVFAARIKTLAQAYSTSKKSWLDKLEILLYKVAQSFLSSLVQKLTAASYSSGISLSAKKQEVLRMVGETSKSLSEADEIFTAQVEATRREYQTAAQQFTVALSQFLSSIEQARELVRKGRDELVALSGLRDKEKWQWVSTTSAQDFTLKLVETIGDLSQYRMPNALAQPPVVSESCRMTAETKFKPREYQRLNGLLGDANLDVSSLFLFHKMGSGKTLTFAEFLVNYIFTCNADNPFKYTRNALILAPQLTNLGTWVRELQTRFAADDVGARYDVKTEPGAKTVLMTLTDRERKQAPFLILITAFAVNLKDNPVAKRILGERPTEWQTLKALLPPKGPERSKLVTQFYADGVAEIFKGSKPPMTPFSALTLPERWKVGKWLEAFIAPRFGVICVDEIQNMPNPRDFVVNSQRNAMTWALIVHLVLGKKVALSGTPALDYERPLDAIKALNIILRPGEPHLPGGVWINVMGKAERASFEEDELAQVDAERQYVFEKLIKKPQEFKRIYRRPLISYVSLERDPTTYPTVYNTCDFSPLPEDRQALKRQPMPQCEIHYTVRGETSATQKTVQNKFELYPFAPEFRVDAIRVLVTPESGGKGKGKGKGEGKIDKKSNVRRKFLVAQDLILKQPNEKNFIFTDAKDFKTGAMSTLMPLIQSKAWKISPFYPRDATSFLEAAFQNVALDEQFEKGKTLADVWYEQAGVPTGEKKMIPLLYLLDKKTEERMMLDLYSEYSAWNNRQKAREEKKTGMKIDEEAPSTNPEREGIARAFLQDFYLALWNHRKNDLGAYFSTILGDIRTKEGLSLFNTRRVFIIDPSKTLSVFGQAVARTLRFCGMAKGGDKAPYPTPDQWFVKVYALLAAKSLDEFKASGESKKSQDMKDWESLQKRAKSPADELFEIFQANAIDCTFFAEYNFGLSSGDAIDEAALEKVCGLPFHKANQFLAERKADKKVRHYINLVSCLPENSFSSSSSSSSSTSTRTSTEGSTEAFPQTLPPKERQQLVPQLFLESPEGLLLTAEELTIGEKKLCSLKESASKSSLHIWNETDELALQFVDRWLQEVGTSGASGSSGETRPFFLDLIQQKDDNVRKGGINAASSAQLLRGFFSAATLPANVEQLFENVNFLLPGDQKRLQTLLHQKRRYYLEDNKQFKLVYPEVAEVYSRIAKAKIDQFYRKLDMLERLGRAKESVKRVPVQPQGDLAGGKSQGLGTYEDLAPDVDTEVVPGPSSQIAQIIKAQVS